MVELLNVDCMDYMRDQPDNAFGLAIVDPPYGIGADKAQNAGGEKWGYKSYKETDWDSKIPDARYFAELKRVSRSQIVWGANYMTEHLPPSMGWVVWNKGQRDFSLADGEMAWTSFNKALRIFDMSRGAALADANRMTGPHRGGGRIHPTQKPIKLYEWLLSKYAKEGDRILDTHLGSASSAIAAHYSGFDFVGTELDEDYFKAASDRFDRETAQQSMF